MLKKYRQTIKQYSAEILQFGFGYSCVIVFALFGPVQLIVNQNNPFYYTLLALMAFILAFWIHPNNLENRKSGLILMGLVGIVGLLLFLLPNSSIKSFSMFAYSFIIARISKSFTYHAYYGIRHQYSGRVLASAFFLAFFILYMVNMNIALLPSKAAIGIPIVTMVFGLYFTWIADRKKKEDAINHFDKNKKDQKLTISLFFLVVVYICGGVSYLGIYPFLEPFYRVDRFYNVLPLLVGLPFAGTISDKYGLKVTLMLGVASLGIGFVFFLLPHSLPVYFGIQTFLQIGWAFVNVFGFGYAWLLAIYRKKWEYFGIGIIAIMIGVMIGAGVAYFFGLKEVGINIYALVTFIPLFIGLMLFSFLPGEIFERRLMDKGIQLQLFNEKIEATSLSPREKEIAFYYCGLNKTVREISQLLFISTNTVNSHLKNIYRKCQVSSRKELKDYLNNEY